RVGGGAVGPAHIVGHVDGAAHVEQRIAMNPNLGRAADVPAGQDQHPAVAVPQRGRERVLEGIVARAVDRVAAAGTVDDIVVTAGRSIAGPLTGQIAARTGAAAGGTRRTRRRTGTAGNIAEADITVAMHPLAVGAAAAGA